MIDERNFGTFGRGRLPDSLDTNNEIRDESDHADADSKGFPLVYAMTLNWNTKDDTLELLDSLRHLDYPNYKVMVVDNGSDDGSVAAIKKLFPDVILIENDRNLGYAEGSNVGIEYAYREGADYFLKLNPDTIVDSSALMELVKVAEQDDRIGFVSGKVYSYDNPETLQMVGRGTDPIILVGEHIGSGEVDRGQYDAVQDLHFVDDVYLLVKRELYEQVGGYDPTYFLYYAETDWCVRARRAGYRIVYAPRAKVWHKGNVTGPSISRSPERHYFLMRNRVMFIARNASRGHLLRYLLWTFGTEALNTGRFLKHGYLRHPISRLRGLGSGMWWLLTNGLTHQARA